MFLITCGPIAVATGTGSRCQIRMARSNFGLSGLRLAGGVPLAFQYSHTSSSGWAPHCFLKWNVPASGVDRPKSNTVKPRSIENFRMCH